MQQHKSLKHSHTQQTLIACLALVCANALAQTPVPTAAALPMGEVKGSALVHTADSARGVVAQAALVLPAAATGEGVFAGSFQNAPKTIKAKVPVVVFMHGSSGLALKAIGEWQTWLAAMGVASVAPDSFALPDRVTYKSPVGKDLYEKIHALRLSEINLMVQALQDQSWADASKLVLAGTSEGAVPVARYKGTEFMGRILYSWGCEDNYFVDKHATAMPNDKPVLNVMSANDVFFSPYNPWLGNPNATGHCGDALKNNKQASIVLIPGAPHTLLNLPPARHATTGFVRDVLKP
jgi:hypothetical protein